MAPSLPLGLYSRTYHSFITTHHTQHNTTASSGISLHADRRCQNQRPRVHITLELAASAEGAIQQLGRSHRANQSSHPEYRLVLSSAGGERRFAAALAKRLESLGALTQGDRRATHQQLGLGLQAFNMDNVYGEMALKALVDHLRAGGRDAHGRPLPPVEVPAEARAAPQGEGEGHEGGGRSVPSFFDLAAAWLRDVGLDVHGGLPSNFCVRIFLNRLLGLQLPRQACLLAYFMRLLEHRVQAARRDGTYDEGIRELKGYRVEMVGAAAAVDMDYPSAETPRALVQDVVVDRGVSWERAQALLAQGRGEAAAQDAERKGGEGEGEGEGDEDEDGEDEEEEARRVRRARRRRLRRQKQRGAPPLKMGEVVGFYKSTQMRSYMLVTPKPWPGGGAGGNGVRVCVFLG